MSTGQLASWDWVDWKLTVGGASSANDRCFSAVVSVPVPPTKLMEGDPCWQRQKLLTSGGAQDPPPRTWGQYSEVMVSDATRHAPRPRVPRPIPGAPNPRGRLLPRPANKGLSGGLVDRAFPKCLLHVPKGLRQTTAWAVGAKFSEKNVSRERFSR